MRYSARAPRASAVPRVAFRPRTVVVSPFHRPYYAFRPRFGLNVGLWVGYPVLYPYYYPYAYPYASPYSYPYPYPYISPYPYPYYGPTAPPAGYPPAYPPSASGAVTPQAPTTGGLSFEITPPEAEVYADGQYVGTVASFTPMSEPLMLTPGRHLVEIRAPGYRTLVFDVDIIAGQVIPYRGLLQRQ